jgi:large subunit ribosomal protein L15
MKLHELAPPEGAHKERRRLGRGHGSGRVKTSGRGTKGQNARTGKGTKPWFEGGQMPWTMKIPHKRGFSRARFKVVAQVVNLRDLEAAFKAEDVVTLEVLRQRGLIRDASGRRPVKLLGDGTLSKPLVVEVHRASAGARAAVEGAGGRLTVLTAPAAPAGDSEGAPAPEQAGGTPAPSPRASAPAAEPEGAPPPPAPEASTPAAPPAPSPRASASPSAPPPGEPEGANAPSEREPAPSGDDVNAPASSGEAEGESGAESTDSTDSTDSQ